jgi:single-stranded DNA-binding protein
MSDINKVWVSGLVVTRPVLTRLTSRTMSAVFHIQVNEKFVDRNGHTQYRPSTFIVESLGKSAEATAEKVKVGSRYTVDGYLREEAGEGGGKIKIRTFAVYPDESQDSIIHKEGIKAALDILEKSADKASAVKTLEELLKS